MMPILRVLRLVTIPLIAAAGAAAQAVTGSLQGRVLTAAAEPLAGVVVTVRSPALLGERNITSDARGRFQFLAIPAGTYSVQLRRVGYGPVRITEVAVPLGATASLVDVRLTAQAVQLTELTVSGARPLLDPTTTAAATALDSSRFRALPTERDFRALLAIVPQASPSAYGDGVNVGGATGYENAYFIDGMHATNPLEGNGSLIVPYNFIKQVQVVTGGYEAEFGRGQGAVINVLTNSGGNDFHGEVVAFFTGHQLRATPRFGIAEVPFERFSQYDVGLSLGGPVRRDRLWFFAAYNPLVETRDIAFGGIGSNHDRRVRHLFAGKLTWRPAPGADLTLTLLGDPSVRKSAEAAAAWPAPLPTITDPRVVLGSFRDGGTAATLQLRQELGRRVLLGAAISRLDRFERRQPRSGPDDHVSLGRLDDYVEGVSSGNFGRSYRNHTSRTAVEASLTILAQAHTIKLGGSFEHNALSQPFFHESFLTKYLTDDGVRYDWLKTVWPTRGHNTVPAFYAQDSWEISPRVRLNGGLRWEAQLIAGDTGRVARIFGELAPRLGLVIQPGALGRQKLFASIGRFYEQIPLQAVGLWTDPWHVSIGTYPQNPLVDSSGGSVFEVPAGHPVERALRGQHYDELTAGYERRVGAAYRIGVRGVLRKMRWVVEDAVVEDPSLGTVFLVGNPGRRGLASLPRATRRYSALELTFERPEAGRLQYLFSYVLSRNDGNYPGLFFTDARQPAPNASVWFDYSSQVAHATGLLPNDRSHLLKLSGSYRVLEGLTVGTLAAFATGTPLSEYAWDPIAGWVANVRDRGTGGRTPSTWSVDLRVAYEIRPSNTRWRPRLLFDVFNLGNQRRPVDFEQLHYFDSAHASPNPNYLKVNQYQAPLSARLGMAMGF